MQRALGWLGLVKETIIIKFPPDLKVIEYTQQKNQMLFSLLNNLNIDPNFPPFPLLSNITFSKLA